MVVDFVAGGVDQRDGFLAAERAEGLDGPRVGVKFGGVAAGELRVACGIVSKPAAERGAGRDVFHPMREGRV